MSESSPGIPSVDADLVAERAEALRTLVDRHRTRPVTIVAVTKRFGADAVAAALRAGLVDIGENYAQELAAKAEHVTAFGPASPRWHFIGHVQRNKVRLVADVVDLWHTVDSPSLGREIAKRSPGAAVLVQVNLADSTGQSGVGTADVAPLVDTLRDLGLDVGGLMMIGAAGDAAATRDVFALLRRTADDLELVECSMGMSGDLESALESGSTMLRVGTGLFGPRPSV
jgi:pyridoxal phosphate enzyme (YggS family)